MTKRTAIELTVVIDSVVKLREQQLWPYPDPLEFARAAQAAGADAVLLSLHAPHVSIRDRDWRTLADLRTTRLCLAAPPRTAFLQRIAESPAARCVLIPEARHEHSSGGALAVSVVYKELRRAAAMLARHDIELGARIDPDPTAVRLCADAGLQSVELTTAAFALAGRPASRARRLEELAGAIDAAAASGLRASVRGGLNEQNIGELIAAVDIAEVRVGQALIAQALFVGIEASIARMRVLLRGEIE